MNQNPSPAAPEIAAAHLELMMMSLKRSGPGDPGEWEDALRAVPRDRFVPDVAICSPVGGDNFLIDRAAAPQVWLKATYADADIITQLDDGAVHVTVSRVISNSGTCACCTLSPSTLVSTVTPIWSCPASLPVSG